MDTGTDTDMGTDTGKHRRAGSTAGHNLRLKEAGMLLQVAVLLAGLPQQLPQLRQRQLVILVAVRRLEQLRGAVQRLGLQNRQPGVSRSKV